MAEDKHMDGLHTASAYLAYEDDHLNCVASEDRRHGWDRRKKDRRTSERLEPLLSEAEIAALLNGAR
jgi:hypothetical protein